MAISKSLGLSSAKKAGAATSKAFRRLFGRVLPGGGPGGTAGTADSRTGSSSFNSNKPAAARDYNNDSSNNNSSTRLPNEPSQDETKNNNAEDKEAATRTDTQTHDEQRQDSDHQLRLKDISANNKTQHTAESNPALDNMPVVSTNNVNKENQPPSTTALAESLGGLTLKEKDEKPVTVEVIPEPLLEPIVEDPAVVAERLKNLQFIGEALDMARLALRTNETPVGCVIVHNDKVIARGMNATNVTRNGTRHAEYMALGALLSYPPEDGPRTTCLKPKAENPPSAAGLDAESVSSRCPDEGNEDGSKGHLYPYGQKCHPDARVDRSIIRESTLYVTVEPCVMCASLLRQLGIKKVYFGAVNDKFGGTGGVFSLHANSLPISPDGQTAAAHPTPRPSQLPDGSGTLGVSFPPGGGDGGNIERGYEIEGGWGRDEAVSLLRQFYVQENGRAPVPRKKEGRAARLQAMMEANGDLTLEEATAAIRAEDGSSPADAQAESMDPQADGEPTVEEALVSITTEDRLLPADAQKENMKPLGSQTDTSQPLISKTIDMNGNAVEQTANKSVTD